jgi:putative endonuclease
VYLVECSDGSLYTGIALDVERRIEDHNAGKGARYTRGRGPVVLMASAGPMDHGDALRLEMKIKRTPAPRKRTEIEAAA